VSNYLSKIDSSQIPTTVRSEPRSPSLTSDDPRRQVQSPFERHALGLILGLSLALQLLVAPYEGFFQDVQILMGWGATFDAHPLMFYALTGSNYPPLTIYILGIMHLVYLGVGHLLGYSNAQLMVPPQSKFAVLWFVEKLPIIAANMGSTVLIYRLARPAISARWALLATLAYAVAPAMLVDGALWGQTDGVPIFFLLLAIVAIQSHRPAWGGVLLSLAVLVKPQPVIFVPILLLYLLRTGGRRECARASLAGLITVLVMCSPFLLPPHLEMLVLYQDTLHYLGAVTVNAYNLWFLVQGVMGSQLLYQTPVIGALTASTIGYLLFAPVYALALVLVWRRPSIAGVYMAMALAAVGFFDLTALQHERYIFQALAFLLLASLYYHSFVLHYLIASTTLLTSFFLLCWPAIGLPISSPPFYIFFSNYRLIAVVTACVNLALLLNVIISCVAWMRASRVNSSFERADFMPQQAVVSEP
jgi:dolichyl-phosphate-mannose-protein mannosyltransferase